jgi:hypothetical protein
VFLHTTDPTLLDAFSQIVDWSSGKPRYKRTSESYAVAFPRRDVSGVIRFGIKSDDWDKKQLDWLADKGAPGYIVLGDGDVPSILKGGLYLIVGVAIVVIGILHARKNSTEEDTI